MISLAEIAYRVRGAGRLMVGDRSGLDHFDGTAETCLGSFWAAAVVAPVYVAMTLTAPAAEPPADMLHFVLMKAIGYVLDWTAWPLVMFYLARALGRGDRYFRYIAAYNWAQVIVFTGYAAALIVARGVLPGQPGSLLLFAATVAILTYEWYIARTALEIGSWPAAGLVVASLLLAILINTVADARA